MTESEAINFLNNNEERSTSSRYVRIKQLSISALEKQIPKKLIGTCQFVSGCCPNCKKYISNWLEYDKFVCCPYCGQRLNFERE